jgi:hypothetical protein
MPVIAAMSAQNLPIVAQSLVGQFTYPNVKIIIYADNDGQKLDYKGQRYALEAAKILNAQIALPEHLSGVTPDGYDARDLLRDGGPNAVGAAFESARPATEFEPEARQTKPTPETDYFDRKVSQINLPVSQSDYDKLNFDEVMAFARLHGASPSWIQSGTNGFSTDAANQYTKKNGEFEFRDDPKAAADYAKSLELGEGGQWQAMKVGSYLNGNYGAVDLWRAVRQDSHELAQEAQTRNSKTSLLGYNASTTEEVGMVVETLLGGMHFQGGLGGVVIVQAESDLPLTLRPKESVLVADGAQKTQAFLDPNSNTMYFVADNIMAGTERAVILHEGLHKHGMAVLGSAGVDRLYAEVDAWRAAPVESPERQVFEAVQLRLAQAGITDEVLRREETIAYAIEESVLRSTAERAVQAASPALTKFLDLVKEKFEAVWQTMTGIEIGLTTEDLIGVAEVIFKREAEHVFKFEPTHTPEFKKWFGQSQITDDTGRPLVLYHGTGQGGFDIFERSAWKTAYGHFFTPSKEAANYYDHGKASQTYEVYLKAETPLRLDEISHGEIAIPENLQAWIVEAFDPDMGDVNEQFMEWINGADLYAHGMGQRQNDLVGWAEENGYDALVFYDAKGGGGVALSYVAFDSEQIKSAIGNNGEFDIGKPSIYESKAPAVSARQDMAYLAAVERGDMIAAQTMVNEAAKRAGYNTEVFHAGTVTERFDQTFAGSGLVGRQTSYIYFGSSQDAVNFYAEAGTERETKKYFLQANGFVEFEGGVPSYNADESFVASFDGGNEFAGAVTRDIVDGDKRMDVYTVPYDENGSTTKAKLADPVTRNSEGQIIPLSERFNGGHEDLRYSKAPIIQSLTRADSIQTLTTEQRGISAAGTHINNPQDLELAKRILIQMSAEAALSRLVLEYPGTGLHALMSASKAGGLTEGDISLLSAKNIGLMDDKTAELTELGQFASVSVQKRADSVQQALQQSLRARNIEEELEKQIGDTEASHILSEQKHEKPQETHIKEHAPPKREVQRTLAQRIDHDVSISM